MVGVTGFEPAASTSQTQKHRFFASFYVLFRAFSSETRAFMSCKVHNSHVVQTCKWSRLWSAPQNRRSIPPRMSCKLQPEVDFLLQLLYHKRVSFASGSRVKICDAVIKDNQRAIIPHYTPSQRDIIKFIELRGIEKIYEFF
jgi:hypothetical protein